LAIAENTTTLAATQPTSAPVVSPLTPQRHRLTVEQFEQMYAAGILKAEDRVELIRGELIEKMNIGNDHVVVVNRLNMTLATRIGTRGIVSIQNPVLLTESLPQADVVVYRYREDFYARARPSAADALLLIEVAESSLRFDREVKLPLYAEAGTQEYWIVDVVGRSIEVCRGPRKDGTFAERRLLDGDAEVSILGLPEIGLKLSEIFGAAQP
jgi:Uma2 family endonuclease